MAGSTTQRIAIVDDDEQVRSALARLLRAHGLVPVVFASGEVFLIGIREQEFHCALLDLHLPGLGGIEAIGAAHELCPDLPIVIMTGYPESGAAQKCAEAGAVGFLIKPIAASTLLSALSMSL